MPVNLRVEVSRAERQILARLAKDYGCDVDALAKVAVEELIAAHASPRTPRRAKLAVVKPQGKAGTRATFAEKPCTGCETPFTPSGPNAKRCEACRGKQTTVQPGERLMDARRRLDAGKVAGEVVWNGTMGRRGVSLSSH